MTHHGPLGPLQLARQGLDRRGGDERVAPGGLASLLADPATHVVDLYDGQMALAGEALVRHAPSPDDVQAEQASRDGTSTDVFVFLGRADDGTLYVARLRQEPSEAAELHGLRAVIARLDDLDTGIFTTSLALYNWHVTHRHCPRCGTATAPVSGGWVRRCPADESEHYPRTDPAIIVAVLDPDDRLLLGHNRAWPDGRFSTLAGFLEPGESLEDAVRREVAEESGIVVGEVTYLGSQPWPFPASLMLGCIARAETTEITVDDEEVTDARWFTRQALTTAILAGDVIPPGVDSIASKLVQYWLGAPVPTGPNSW